MALTLVWLSLVPPPDRKNATVTGPRLSNHLLPGASISGSRDTQNVF